MKAIELNRGQGRQLAVELWLNAIDHRGAVTRFLSSQPLLPGWRVRVQLEHAGPVTGVARVSIMDATSIAGRSSPLSLHSVLLLDDPGQIGLWRGVGCVLLATELDDHLGEAITQAAAGHVWLSPRIAPYLPERLASVGAAGPRQVPLSWYAQLTVAEAETLSVLLEGLSNEDIAEKRGVKVTTVKSCVRSILRKSGCRRRSELIALIALAERNHRRASELIAGRGTVSITRDGAAC